MARKSRWSSALFLRKNTTLPPPKSLLLTLPNELLLIIALQLTPKDLNRLLRTNRRLANLLKSSLYDVAFRKEPRGPRAVVVLRWAAKTGHEDVVKLLLNLGASTVNPPLWVGIENPLHVAAGEGHAGVVRLMMEHESANEAIRLLDNHGNTPFHLAALKGQESVVKVLLESGINPNLPSDTSATLHGATPLHYAAAWGYSQVVRVLLEHGANANSKTTDPAENTPLQWAVENFCSMIYWKPLLRPEQTIKILLEHGADVNYSDKHGRTALHFASTSYKYCQKERFGEYFSQIPFASDVVRPKRAVAKTLHKDIISVLLENGADINARDNDGKTPLYCAAESERDDEYSMRNFVELGADVNAQTLAGDTTIQMVMSKYWLRDSVLMGKVLLEAGADLGIKDERGVSAFDVAMTMVLVTWDGKRLARLIKKGFARAYPEQALAEARLRQKLGYGWVVSRLLARVSRGGSQSVSRYQTPSPPPGVNKAVSEAGGDSCDNLPNEGTVTAESSVVIGNSIPVESSAAVEAASTRNTVTATVTQSIV